MKFGGVLVLTFFIIAHGVPGPLQPDLGGLVLRQATHELLQFLEAERSLELSANATHQGSNQSAMPPWEVFKPACVAHTRKLIRTIDLAYTDAQLRTVLENECSMDKMFVSVETGFGDDDACKRFAKLLSDARDMELKDGSVDGYHEFCEHYYVFKGGKKGKSAEKEKKSKGEETGKEIAKIEQGVETTAKANATNNTKGSAVSSTKEESTSTGTKTEQQKRKEMIPSWGIAVIGFGLVLFILATVIVYSRRAAQ
mmetsp:Transcript_81873/g.162595  ORF Transcript_81873/g.162595 Transcript_81873/m.162595 type:complete len:255 (-) Transcript_81873:44-808(-)